MSIFSKLIIPVLVGFILHIPLIAEDKQLSDKSPEYIRLLISQLGAADFAERKNATRELIRLGYYARGEVEKALESKDPEVRMRVKDIWEKIKWALFPGAGHDVNQLLSEMDPEVPDPTAWDEISKNYGPEILYLLVHLEENKPEYSIHVISGIVSLLNNSDSKKIAEFIDDSPEKDKFINLLISLPEHMLKLADSNKLQIIFDRLGRKEESVLVAASCWRMGKSAEISPDVLRYFEDEEFTFRMFSKVRKKLNRAKTSVSNDWSIGFFAKLAKDLNRKDLIKDLLTDLDYSINNKIAVVYLAEVLISISLYQEAIDVLSEIHTPNSIYLRAVAYHNSGDEKTGIQLMDLLSTKLVRESVCFSVAEEMRKFKDKRAVDLWTKIIEMDPEDSVYDSNARFRLAAFYESEGEYRKAADLLEKGLLKIEGLMLMTDYGESNSEKTSEESIKLRINRLREQDKGGASLWLKAIKAIQKEKYTEAMENFQKFADNNPNYPWTYYNIALILAKQNENEKAVKFLDKAIKFVSDKNESLKIDFLLKKSFVLMDLRKYAKAVEVLTDASDLDPDNIKILSILAMTTYYSGDFQKSSELFARNFAMDPDDLYTQLWRYISLRKIGKDPNPEFSEIAGKVEGEEWPVPLIRYYDEKITLEECLKKTSVSDKIRENEMKCEAYYFIGELFLLNGKKKEAEKYFNKCIECNITDFREHKASLIRLEELKF